MTNPNITQFPSAGRMTEQEYDRARAELGDRKDGKARWDQQLAALFYRSGWTHEKLAAKEGRSRPYITRTLQFGRFLTNVPIGTSPKNLTERRFREYWEKTAGNNERQRFAEVQKRPIAERFPLNGKLSP